MSFVRAALAVVALLAATAASSTRAFAQESTTRTRKALSIGNHPRVDGIRINFMDRDLERVRGVNLTAWRPTRNESTGLVQGFALGVPLTGAGEIRGLAAGIFGVEASGDITGITVAGVGGGAGGTLSGISVGGIGLGAGGGIRGAAVGGVGVGSGGDVRGIAIGGIGVGAGGDARGMLIGGIGAAAGGSIRGMAIGGIGVGAGGSVRGLAVGGVGVGVGGRMSGIAIGGIGVGAGGTLHGIAISGLAVGAPTIEGGVLAPLVGGEKVTGVIIAPVLFRTALDGEFTGGSLAAVNTVRGHQHGLTIGLVNYAHTLRGVQVGVVNIVTGNPSGRRVLPIVNWGSGR